MTKLFKRPPPAILTLQRVSMIFNSSPAEEKTYERILMLPAVLNIAVCILMIIPHIIVHDRGVRNNYFTTSLSHNNRFYLSVPVNTAHIIKYTTFYLFCGINGLRKKKNYLVGSDGQLW